MLSGADLIGFVGTSDVTGARRFYEGTLGLTVLDENPYALVLDVNGTMLRVTAVPGHAPAAHTVCGWRVDDIAACVRALSERGVSFLRFDGMEQDDLGVWATPGGDKVAWFNDPDGNVLSFTQFS